MLVIRLSRTGRRNLPHFRVVVAEKSAPIKGKFVEILGHFDPIQKILKVAKDRVIYWFENGAQPTQRVAKLLLKYEDLKTAPIIERPERKPKKETKEEKPAENKSDSLEGEAPAEEKKEAPAEEKIEEKKGEPKAEEKKEEKSEEPKEDAPAEGK